jgi:hypothetical protein
MGRAARRLGGALALALAGHALAPAPAPAVVACQKGKQVKLRDACKGRETPALDFGRDPSGVWQYTGSEGRGGSIGTPFLGTGLTPRFLTLDPDGGARVNLENEGSGALACADFPWARGASPAITVDLTRVQYQGTRVLRTAASSADTLRLTDNLGVTLIFSRATAVAPAFECLALAEQQRFTGLPEPDYSTGLAFDGLSLWYTELNTGMVYPVDPGTGAAGTPVDLGFFSQYAYVHAAQAGDFWTHCNCGGNEKAVRRSPGGSDVDTVDTDVDLGEKLGIRALAFDPAAGVLWIAGNSADSYAGRLLQVATDVEPDTLVSSAAFATELRALAFDGSNLWGLTQDAPQSVLRIDPATARATATYAVPAASVDWRGVAAVAGQIFLVGATPSNEGVLVAYAPAP